jgi:hypothetical protein
MLRLRALAPLVGLTLVLATASVGCHRRPSDSKADIQAYVTTALPAAKQSLASMKAACQQLIAMPPLTADGSYGGPAISADDEDLGLLAIDYHLGDRPWTLDLPSRWAAIQDTIGGRTDRFSTVAEAKRAFGLLSDVKYVFIVKTLARKDPVVTDSSAHGSFIPGNLSAEGHLFALEATPRYLGGFRFHAANSDSFSISATQAKMHDEAVNTAKGDLTSRASAAFKDGVKTFSGGKITIVY